MNAPKPKALNIPRVPHTRWRLPWLQIGESKRLKPPSASRQELHTVVIKDAMEFIDRNRIRD